ncbi:DNA end-binding protein Ku [Seinonella peptonophila]|uniref:Non-homologous end joining protein Ku n=1 Tax=Seinonella peptonophila TaxID=112248 RepID=A0A1M4T920_9BACL|nr:Ku protein [Seinonella peptonophila]SHE40971.1 DNA end-binding protein Ku [Seinonella peptonophila]
MRSMWKGIISFGLVNIPISLYKATDDQKTRFRTLHDECKHPIQYKKWCSVCDREVQPKETVRGYEYASSSYVIVSDDDLKGLPLPTMKTIEILHFTDQGSIDPIYYDKSYYLGPGEYGAKPYKLLLRAMEETHKVAVAKVAFRTSEHLSLIRLHEQCLMMNIIHYPAEVRSIEGVPGIEDIRGIEVSDAELSMANRLIEEISSSFKDDYQSNYEEALKELIEVKVQNKEIAQPEAEMKNEKVVDLMEALQQSLKQTKNRSKAVGAVEESVPTTRRKRTTKKKAKANDL